MPARRSSARPHTKKNGASRNSRAIPAKIPPNQGDQLTRQSRFLAAYIKDGTVSGACNTAMVGRKTHYDWLDADAEGLSGYRARFAEAHEAAVDRAESELRRRGILGVAEPVFYQGEVCGTVQRYSDACLIFYLKGRRGDVFKDRAELTGPNGGPIQTEDLSRIPSEQLEQMRQWLIEAREQKRLGDGAIVSSQAVAS